MHAFLSSFGFETPLNAILESHNTLACVDLIVQCLLQVCFTVPKSLPNVDPGMPLRIFVESLSGYLLGTDSSLFYHSASGSALALTWG